MYSGSGMQVSYPLKLGVFAIVYFERDIAAWKDSYIRAGICQAFDLKGGYAGNDEARLWACHFPLHSPYNSGAPLMCYHNDTRFVGYAEAPHGVPCYRTHSVDTIEQKIEKCPGWKFVEEVKHPWGNYVLTRLHDKTFIFIEEIKNADKLNGCSKLSA